MDSSSYRQSLLADFQEQRKYAETLLVRSSKEQLLWQPNDETWCMAQVVEHMRIVNDNYLKRAAGSSVVAGPANRKVKSTARAALDSESLTLWDPKETSRWPSPRSLCRTCSRCRGT